MTHPDIKSALDRALDEQISKMFAVFVANLLTEEESAAVAAFRKGLTTSIKAHQLSTKLAEEVAP